MKNKRYIAAFACCIAAIIVFLPMAVWQIWLGDRLYDSLFSDSLASLPVVRAGRVMPASSAASDVLKSVSGRVSAKIGGKKVSATKWLWSINANSEKMADEKFFRTDNRDLQKILSADGRNYSYNSFADKYETLYSAADGNSAYSRACDAAVNSGLEYAAAANAFGVKFDGDRTSEESLSKWKKSVGEASAEFEKSRLENRPPDHSKLVKANDYLQRLRKDFEYESPNTSVRTIPSKGKFESALGAMLDRKLDDGGALVLSYYAQIRDAIADGNDVRAANILKLLHLEIKKTEGVNLFKIKFENFINSLDPFFGGFILYGLSLAALALSGLWKSRAEGLATMAMIFLAAAIGEHFIGICARMYIQMRPPVTNLYSSVVFTGGVAALIGWITAYKRETTSFSAAAAATGFLSLLVAMNLPYSGDTMGMMRAVLNSNFWLTIHVVTIMVGYCGLFLGGFIAAFRLVANLFSRENFGMLTGEAAKNVYAILCFSLIFSFAGTMLGGIWADMSWGRFWGWDPKENGALMVVLWTAAAIHVRTLKIGSDRIFLGMAVVGNIVGAWAWFGVNLMGVGLHAYGFMEGGWTWFFAFVLSQILIAPLCFYKYVEKK